MTVESRLASIDLMMDTVDERILCGAIVPFSVAMSSVSSVVSPSHHDVELDPTRHLYRERLFSLSLFHLDDDDVHAVLSFSFFSLLLKHSPRFRVEI